MQFIIKVQQFKYLGFLYFNLTFFYSNTFPQLNQLDFFFKK